MKQKLLIKKYVSKNSKMLNDYLNRRDLVKYKYIGKGVFETIALDSNGVEDGSRGKIISFYDTLENGLETYIYNTDEIDSAGVFILISDDNNLYLKRLINESLKDFEVLFILINNKIFISRQNDFLNKKNIIIKEINGINSFRENINSFLWNIGEGNIINIKLYFKYNIKYLYFNLDYFNEISTKIEQLFVNNKIIINNNSVQKTLLLVEGNVISLSIFKSNLDVFTLDLSRFIRIFTDFKNLSYSIELNNISKSIIDFTKIPAYSLNDFIDYKYLSTNTRMVDIISQKRHKQIPFIQTLSRFMSIMHYRYNDFSSNKDAYISKYLNGFKLIGRKPDGITGVDEKLISREYNSIINMQIDNKSNKDNLKMYMNFFYGYSQALSVFHSGRQNDNISYIDFTRNYEDGQIILFQEIIDTNNFNKYFISLNIDSIKCSISNDILGNVIILAQVNDKLVIEEINSSIGSFTDYKYNEVVGGIDYIASGLFLNESFITSINDANLGSNLVINITNIPVTSSKKYEKDGSFQDVEYVLTSSIDASISHYLSLNRVTKEVLRDTTSLVMINNESLNSISIMITLQILGNNINTILTIIPKLLKYISDGVYEIEHSFSNCVDCDEFKVYYYINEGKILLINTIEFVVIRYSYDNVFIPSKLNPKKINNEVIKVNARTILDKDFYSYGGARYASRFVDTYIMDRLVYYKKMMFKVNSKLPIKKLMVTYPQGLSTKNFLVKLKYNFHKNDIKVIEKDNSFYITIRNTAIVSGVNNWIIIKLYYINAFTSDEKKLIELGNLDINMIE